MQAGWHQDFWESGWRVLVWFQGCPAAPAGPAANIARAATLPSGSDVGRMHCHGDWKACLCLLHNAIPHTTKHFSMREYYAVATLENGLVKFILLPSCSLVVSSVGTPSHLTLWRSRRLENSAGRKEDLSSANP
jgi:hypothetical protein